MLSVRSTQEFQAWLDALKDGRAKVRIAARLRQAGAGNLGDWKPIAGPISEMKIDVGPGYRLYFTRQGDVLIICSRAVASPRKRVTYSGRKAYWMNWN